MDIIEDISQKNIDALPFDEWAEMACLDFDGDVIITDPCYLLHGIDRNKYRHWWDFSNKIILEGGLENSTYYGDWGCTVYKKDNCDIGERGKKARTDRAFLRRCGDGVRCPSKGCSKAQPQFQGRA